MWLWALLVVLVAAIVGMEVFQIRVLKRLDATPPRAVMVLRVMNLLLLITILAYVAWVMLLRGR